ncbi:MAG TPA: hypothetical protein VFQ79_22495 [Bryobacteraceae bacterium]|nr:hypothetical protein [Bryobacteraceae bacterium]
MSRNRRSLAESLEVVARYVPRTLIRPRQMQAIRELAGLLPPIAVAGFECRLAEVGGRVDFAVFLPSSDSCFSVVAGMNPSHELAPELLEDPTWQHIRTFCRSVHEPGGPLHGVVDDVWLEFDLPSNGNPTLTPALFFGISRAVTSSPGNSLEIVESTLKSLGAPPLAGITQSEFLRAASCLPVDSVIFQIGIPLAYRASALRLCISGLPPGGIAPYLRKIEWRDTPLGLENTITDLAGIADELFLDIDIGEISTRKIGIEAHFRGPKRPIIDRRWEDLLSWLVREGLCAPEVERDIRRWTGTTYFGEGGAPKPKELLALTKLLGGRATLCFLRGLHHVKISYEPRRGFEAKGYIGFKRHWIETMPANLPALKRSGRPPFESSVRDTLAAGVEFLAGSRDPNGWWKDFELAAGASDTWVTAYVGWALAGVDEPQSWEMAHAAWCLLKQSLHPHGGWGYNLKVSPDADSTAWAILLGESVGDSRSLALRTAKNFLRSHLRTSGGVATYAEESPVRAEMRFPAEVSYAGWTTAHPCVTALAANIQSFRARLIPFLLRSQRKDGNWPAYWWMDPEYATALAVLALNGIEGLTPEPASRLRKAVRWIELRLAEHLSLMPDASAPQVFAIAWCLKALAACAVSSGQAALIQQAMNRLIDAQLPDGSWTASARLRVPPTDCMNPNRIHSWYPGGKAIRGISLDQQRTFTTATAVSAISAGAERLAELTH